MSGSTAVTFPLTKGFFAAGCNAARKDIANPAGPGIVPKV